MAKISIFKLAFDPACAAFSPGTLLTAHLMEHVIDHANVKEIDFLIGDDEYKKLWMSHRRERWGIVACNPQTVIGLALLV
ncbi:MAG: GNAT family N-acetyltransferase [Sulfuritalea sp.]|nr:GNAT family N-acetyltransferase [Sulfuritalea sp.]